MQKPKIRKSVYQKKEEERKVLKQQRLEEVRLKQLEQAKLDIEIDMPKVENKLNEDEEEEKVEKSTYQDVNIMQIRNTKHNIVSTRLRILAQQDLPRRYIHKDQFLYDQTFDPIRMKFKVKTIDEATVTSGKGPEHYFIQAMKYCERNLIPQAIEEFRKGLMIKPDHLLCRFNHGVLMFKLGLVKQSEYDFQLLVDKKTKDPGAYYNLAVVKVQQGFYAIALDLL